MNNSDQQNQRTDSQMGIQTKSRTDSQAKIPKKIHYVWVGDKDLPADVKELINYWQQKMPDFEFVFWNNENIPRDSKYVNEMFSRKKWAFVSDYVRFWALQKEGGIYLDTDMEVLKPLHDFLDLPMAEVSSRSEKPAKSFFGRTSSDGYISCGIIGATPQNEFIKKVLEKYDSLSVEIGSGDFDFDKDITSPMMVTETYSECSEDEKDAIKIYNPEVFYPCNAGEKCTPEKLEKAYTNHLWHESWVPFRGLRKFLRSVGALDLFKKIFKK
jgi:mannosyltransferase OCH1-like enzyme